MSSADPSAPLAASEHRHLRVGWGEGRLRFRFDDRPSGVAVPESSLS
jgi:hypothetical protein